MIVKVQLPLAGSTPNPAALVYNRSRKCMMTWPVNAELKEKMDGEVKAFFNTMKNDKGRIVLLEKVAEQGW